MVSVAERYRRFARVEAAGRSPLYEKLALHVADAPEALGFLSRMPPEKQQPNLLFAALRLVAGTPETTDEFDVLLNDNADAVAAVMAARSTQTNEPARCATLLPSLASIRGPLALIEIGASAGLCLLPDLYGYDWGHQSLMPPERFGRIAPIFSCTASQTVPLPRRHPEIVWRAGLDLNPLDVSNAEDVRWLEYLVWPENTRRLERLRSAIRVASVEKPRIVAGDLRKDLEALIAEAPTDTTVVIFHTAVLSYVSSQSEREDFAGRMLGSKAIWLSNESHKVFPRFSTGLSALRENLFLLTVDGSPQAWTGPHGQEIHWI
jgi:hypothetical protein